MRPTWRSASCAKFGGPRSRWVCWTLTKKVKVEEALRKFDRPIVVFIDDLDRLFPQEVYEMVRIVKAIGDLPNVGYVLAFDPQYVSQALAVAAVPNASSYMDKIVQVRLPLPAISLEARRGLINEALEQLPAEAHESYFPEALDRMRGLYFSGLREVLEQPRDFARVFNSVGVLEPVLRGEVVLADVVGLAALMVKAEPVYELLRSEPRLFVGLLPSDSLTSRLPKDIVKAGSERRSHAYEKCGNTAAVRALVHHLFPLVEEAEAKYSLGRVQGVRGHLADPSRFLVAHQLRVGGEDVSFVRVRRFLTRADERSKLVEGLTQENCLEFLELLGDYAKSGGVVESSDVAALCLDVARMVEAEPFLTKAKNDSGVFSFPVETVAARAISSICEASAPDKGAEIARQIVSDSRALSVAAELYARSYLSQDGDGRSLCAATDKSMLAKQLLRNVVAAAEQGGLFDTAHPGFILWILAKAAPRGCKRIFDAIYKADPSLDMFALAYLGSRSDSVKGRSFSLPDDPKHLEVFCNLKWLTNHAKTRLKDSAVQLPVKAAWTAVVEGGRFYGVDGSRAR